MDLDIIRKSEADSNYGYQKLISASTPNPNPGWTLIRMYESEYYSNLQQKSKLDNCKYPNLHYPLLKFELLRQDL